MTYGERLTLAAVCSVALHVAVFPLGVWCSGPPAPRDTTRAKPIVLNLQPEKRPEPRRLIDTDTPAEVPVQPTDLISDRDANAQDLSAVEGTRPAPYFDEPSEFDELAAIPSPLPPLPQEEGKQPEEAPTAEVDIAKILGLVGGVPSPSLPYPPSTSGEGIKDENDMLPIPPSPQSDATPTPARGRVDGGLKRRGFLGFEAMSDEVAPYLQKIRNRVGRQWHAALALRYSGTSPTRAVVDCAITPDGEVLYATIVEPGNSASFAPLCKEAIEAAGPFGAFPFKVPTAYRSPNLEISWTFSFLE